MTDTALALTTRGHSDRPDQNTFVLPVTFDQALGGDSEMDRPPSLTFHTEEANALSAGKPLAVVVNALDQRGGVQMTTKPRPAILWSPEVSAPLLAKPTGGHDPTDLDGGTWVVVDE